MVEQLFFSVPPDCDGMQAKWFLKGRCGLSTRMITQLKREKDSILMNGKNLRSIDPVVAGAQIVITLPQEEMRIEPVGGALDILYEDDSLLILNKPPFMPVHPVKQHQTDTLANRVAAHCAEQGNAFVFRAIGRLDRDTSGTVLVAKNLYAANLLKHGVSKVYYALVHGAVTHDGVMRAPIGLKEDSKIVRHVLKEGTSAVTHYEVIFSCPVCSLLRLWLETGKTHQIRCHMASLGHPLLGDDLYGGQRDLINRQALHCGEITLTHPLTNKKISLSAPMPADMLTVINKFRD